MSVVGTVGWIIGNAADAGDAAAEEKESDAAGNADSAVDAGTASETKSATIPKDGSTLEENMQILRCLLATSSAFRDTMLWIQESKRDGRID